MELKAGHILYVRIDYKVDGPEETEQDGLAAMQYLESILKKDIWSQAYLVTWILVRCKVQ